MYYRRMTEDEGEGGRLFRDVDEIRAEIRDVRERIDQTNQAFNIRSLLVDLLFGEEESPVETAGKIKKLLSEAETASQKLRELLSVLEELKEELSDAKRAVRAST